MSERIMEADLREIEAEAEYESIETTRPRRWSSEEVLELTREVRRLRGLIVAATGTWSPDLDAAGALLAEARAIRGEQP